MYTSLVLRKLKADWDAISGINTLIPGKLQEGVNTQTTGNPYARCEVTFEKAGYKSDSARYASYAILVEVAADGATPATQLSIEQALEALLTASKSGSLGGGGGEPTGSVSFAWDRSPGTRSLQTAEERRGGKNIMLIRKAMALRVEWA